jgi:hypothetical protein
VLRPDKIGGDVLSLIGAVELSPKAMDKHEGKLGASGIELSPKPAYTFRPINLVDLRISARNAKYKEVFKWERTWHKVHLTVDEELLQVWFPFRHKGDRLLRRLRISDIILLYKQRRREVDLVRRMEILSGMPYILTATILLGSLICPDKRWFWFWQRVGALKGPNEWIAVTKAVSDYVKVNPHNDGWEWYVECANMIGHMLAPLGEYNLKDEVIEGTQKLWPRPKSLFGVDLPKAMFYFTHQICPRQPAQRNIDVADYYYNGGWARPSTSYSPNRKLEIGGDKVTLTKKLELMLYGDKQLQEILAGDWGRRFCRASGKEETTKIRPVYGGDDKHNFVDSYLVAEGDNYYYNWPGFMGGLTLEQEIDEAVFWANCDGNVFTSDLETLDHQARLYEAVAGQWHSYGAAGLTPWARKSVLSSLDNEVFVEGKSIGPQTNGVTSGSRTTTAQDHNYNLFVTNCALADCSFRLPWFQPFSRLSMLSDDDRYFWSGDSHSMEAFVEAKARAAMLALHKCGVWKTSRGGAGEFLRIWHEGGVIQGYPMRSIISCVSRKAWNPDPLDPTANFRATVSAIAKNTIRGADFGQLSKVIRLLAPRFKLSSDFCLADRLSGGLGLGFDVYSGTFVKKSTDEWRPLAPPLDAGYLISQQQRVPPEFVGGVEPVIRRSMYEQIANRLRGKIRSEYRKTFLTKQSYAFNVVTVGQTTLALNVLQNEVPYGRDWAKFAKAGVAWENAYFRHHETFSADERFAFDAAKQVRPVSNNVKILKRIRPALANEYLSLVRFWGPTMSIDLLTRSFPFSVWFAHPFVQPAIRYACYTKILPSLSVLNFEELKFLVVRTPLIVSLELERYFSISLILRS